MHGFSRFGQQGYWQVAHKPSFMCHLSVSPEPELEKLCISPKVIQLQNTQGLIETLGSMVIFDENQAVSDINKYEFLYQK
jgi:hypothetical protein